MEEGTHTVGAQRQYTGTAGRIENAGSASTWFRRRRAPCVHRSGAVPAEVLDRCLERCRCAGGSDGVRFATKPRAGDDRPSSGSGVSRRRGWPVTRHTATTPSCVGLHERRIGYVLGRCSRPPGQTGIGVRRAVDLAVRPARPRVGTAASRNRREGSTLVRQGTGSRGTAGPSSRCSPTRSWPSPRPPREPGPTGHQGSWPRNKAPACSTTPATAGCICCIGHAGDAATKPGHPNATTAVEQPNSSDHKLLPEY